MEKFREIIKEEELNSILYETVEEIGDVVTSTLGPYGSTVILTNRFEGPYPTKDGVSVIRSVGYKDPVKNTIAQILKEVSEKTLKTAGDGTTTAICLAQAIINIGRSKLQRGANYLELSSALEELEEYVMAMLDEMSEPLDDDNIIDVATISANGDKAMGKIIEEAFRHSKNVKVEEGFLSYDTIEKVNGMILDTGYLDPAFVNVPEKDEIEYTTPFFLIVDGKLNDLREIGPTLEKLSGNFIIIADDVSPNVRTILRDNYNRGALNIGIMKTPGFGGHRTNLVKDLKIFTEHKKRAHGDASFTYGTADSIVIGRDKTTISKTKVSKECTKHLEDLKKLVKERTDSQSIDLLNIRISNLEGSLSIIKVGGISSIEVKEKYDRYDDAVLAVGCALEEGIIAGGGQALYETYERLQESPLIQNPFMQILLAPTTKIEKNSNFKLQIVGVDMFAKKVFDPTKVTKTAFKNAVSVSKMILNTKNLILDRTLWV